jgi:hypothetical protein
MSSITVTKMKTKAARRREGRQSPPLAPAWSVEAIVSD